MIQHSYKQSDYDFPDLSVAELLKLSHYIQAQNVNATCFLSMADSDLNLRQTSKFYLQRRKGVSNVTKSQVHKSKPLQHGKEFLASKSAISKHTVDKHTSHQVKDEAMSSMSKIDEAKSNEESSKSQGILKGKRQKIEKIPSKKSSQVEKASSQSLKEFQKDSLQQFQDHLTNKTTQKILLSEFMQTNKSKAIGEISPSNSTIKPSKTEKCAQKSHFIEPSHQPYQGQQEPHQSKQEIHKEEGKESNSSKTKYPKSALKVTPQKQANRSKGKSKTKNPKQSSFYKPNIKINGSEVYGPQKIQAIPSQAVLNDYAAKDNRHHQKKIVKQNNIFKKKINIKCQERVPVEVLPSSPQSQSPNYKESQLDQKYYEPDYNKYKSHLMSQVEEQEKQEIDKTYMDFYAIDISPCKAKGSSEEKGSMDMIELPSSLASKLKQEEAQKKAAVPQSEAVSKPSKSSRKKIFQLLPSKPAEQMPQKTEAQADALNDQEMRMLLGVKGNKYKQAIVMQYIKENRRCKVK